MPFCGGLSITIVLNLFRAVMKRKSLQRIIMSVILNHNFDLATFLGMYGGVFKVRNYLYLFGVNLGLIHPRLIAFDYLLNIYHKLL